MRSRLVVVGIVALALASCATVPTAQDANDAVLMLQKYEAWAWAIGIALIWADVVLPVPQTVVIAALGIIYGTVLGGLLGSVGLITGGLLGYVLMLTSARRLVKRFIGRQSLDKMESLFERAGAWAIVLTRSLSYSIPEAMVFLAGLAGMPLGKFSVALAVGSVPTAFAFAAIGAGWADQPILAFVVSYVLPILLLPDRALSHAPPSIVRDVNDTRHGSPCGTMRMRHPSPAARAIRNNPDPTTAAPMARATRSPAGARRSTVMAAPTTAIARRSMIPMTRRIIIRPAQQWLQWRPRRRPCRQAVRASAGNLQPRPGASRQQAR